MVGCRHSRTDSRDIHIAWRVELVLLYCFVSALGVMNELAEYAGEFMTRTGMFSWDRHDTWRDLAANTIGATTAWIVYRIYVILARRPV